MAFRYILVILYCVKFSITLFTTNSYYFTRSDLCVAAVRNCNRHDGNTGTPVSLLEPIGQTPAAKPNNLSVLIAHNSTAFPDVKSPIIIDDRFVETFSLLYDNPHQLRVLLTLFKDSNDSNTVNWLRLLHDYKQCFTDIIYTCSSKNKVCEKHVLSKISYTQNIFVENVIGFDFYHIDAEDYTANTKLETFNMTISILLHNPESSASRIVRISSENLSLFDAILNMVRFFYIKTKIQLDLLMELEAYNTRLPFRGKAPVLLIRSDN